MMGYSNEEYEKIAKTNSIEDSLQIEAFLKTIKQEEFTCFEETIDHEYQFIDNKENVIWININASTIIIDEIQYIFATFKDISAKKQIEKNMALISENIGCSLSLIKVSKGNEEVIFGNSAFYKNIGIEEKNYKKSMNLINHTAISVDDCKRIADTIKETLTTGKMGEITHRYIFPN